MTPPVDTRNHEITASGPLLTSDGTVREPGWARSPLLDYDRQAIAAPRWRIKEWDYYIALTDTTALAFTVCDGGYFGMVSVSWVDLTAPSEHTETVLIPLPMGRLKLPRSSTAGVSQFVNSRVRIRFETTSTGRKIRCHMKNFSESEDFKCVLTMEQPGMDSLMIATPWAEDPRAFYYNQKVNCMPVRGSATWGSRRVDFDAATDFCTLDWGRGVWTYDNRWYWGSGNARIDGVPFGFNIGYGFGDTSAASENVIFYDGVAHKLDDVLFQIPHSYTDPWQFTSSDHRFETVFEPIIDRSASMSVGPVATEQHQVFGRMSGHVVLDDGTDLELRDVVCFAEDVHNRY